MNWTKNQKHAIESASGDITVAASAGTGKTSVLSHRCVRVLSAADLCPDVSGVLVLTFTDAAAGEMNVRIAQCLKDAAARTGDLHLRKQLLLIDDADISTIHSFCKRVITQHFHRLGLDPAVRVMDADESKLIKAEVLEQIIELSWQDLPDGMRLLLKDRVVAGGGRSFLNCIISISDFLDTVVSRDEFFDRAAAFNDSVMSASSEAVKNQKQIIIDRLKIFKEQFEWSLKLDEKISDSHWKEQIAGECLPVITLAADFMQKDNFPAFIELLNSFDGFRWNDKPKGYDNEKKDLVLSSAKKAIEGFRNLSLLAIISDDYQHLVAGACSAQMKVLTELVKRFDRAYQQEKQRLGCVDFADLERYMLRLLCEEQDIDSGKPSDIAIGLQKKYKYIFVDEYQDINPVQQKIIDLLSGSAKVFVVGDVKQSIYAWRGADCGLFVNRLNTAAGDKAKSRIDLNENFRSRPGILNFVNAVFEKIMTASVAAIDYDENAALKACNNSAVPTQTKPDVEFIIVSDDSTEPQDDDNENAVSVSDDAVNRRALVVAARIKKLIEVEKFEVYDKAAGVMRPCRWGDVVILTRSMKERANNYVQILRSANIPVISDSSAGYFETTEISDMLSLLGVLDNPRQDIALAAVLRSPIFGITDTDFAAIKNYQKDKADFYSALEFAADSRDDKKLGQRISDILACLDKWRTLARHGSLADLIWQIYSQTDYLAFVSAMPGGAQRRANLLKLHHRAIQFENFASSFNCISLSRFVGFLQKLLDAGGDWSPAEPDSSAIDAVRVMSVHKSKGLEFPIVILAETNRRFGGGGHSSDCITDGASTIGLKIIEHNSGAKLNSLAWQIIREKQRKQTIAEEMRILYVAMTRARDRLILTGAAKSQDCVKILSNAAMADSAGLPDGLIADAKSELDWLLMAFANSKKLNGHFKLPIEVNCIDENLFDFRVCSVDEILQIEKQLSKSRPQSRYQQIKSPIADEKMLAGIMKNLNWRYKFEKAAGIKAKQSITSLVRSAEAAGEQFASADYDFSFDSFEKLTDKQSSLVVGSATHLVMQNIDLDRIDVERTIKQLLEKGCIDKQTAGKIDKSAIEKFFNSDIGLLLQDKNNIIMREWPFTYAASAADLYPDAGTIGDEKIIVQGIIDMLIKTPNGLIVIDFKTDRINQSQLQQRAERYAPQLKWYCKAAGEILGQKNTTGRLYFLATGLAINIE
ncbi:MAG: helicase-exonuclease AddAB subunit AddA [Phycisphaerae bacterium]|jgi:ATP-dependent helicase/nuclease subunit A